MTVPIAALQWYRLQCYAWYRFSAIVRVEAKVLNQAVKRNVERFPNDFRFQLTKEECLRSQCALNEKQGQHLKYMPYAFTEQGVAMLSSVLRSQTAIEVNIRKQQRTYL